jgi:putative methionine-R-sulfoxide reductase with GAF domain
VAGIYFQEWRIADRAASAADKALLRASMAAIEGSGSAPTTVMVEAAARLRQLADDLYRVAMAESERRAAQLGVSSAPSPLSGDDVIVEPEERSGNSPSKLAGAEALLSLSETLARKPEEALRQLVMSAMKLTNADSAGLSLEDDEAGELVLRWIATAGEFSRYQNGTMPRHFSPCGTAMERRTSLVMRDPVRHYPYISQLHVPVHSVLLVPFARRRKFVGTLWVAAHKTEKKFDVEEKRMIEGLATFASAILDSNELRSGKAGG